MLRGSEQRRARIGYAVMVLSGLGWNKGQNKGRMALIKEISGSCVASVGADLWLVRKSHISA